MDNFLKKYLDNEFKYLSTRDNLPEFQLFYEGYRCALENIMRVIEAHDNDDIGEA